MNNPHNAPPQTSPSRRQLAGQLAEQLAGPSHEPSPAESIERRVLVQARDAVLVKALVESYEGLASVFSQTGGDLTLSAPRDREDELDELVDAISELLSNK